MAQDAPSCAIMRRMNRRDFFFRQKVTEGEIDAAFSDAEDAIHQGFVDLGFYGLMVGLVASQHSPTNLTVDVTGGSGRSPQGERIAAPSTQQVDLSVDWQNVSTAVNNPGNSKIISLFVKFTRALSNPRTDGNGANVYYDRMESYRYFVTQGAEAVSPSAPPLESDGLLIADITITNGQTMIVNANISTSRRQDLVIGTGSPVTLRTGSYLAAIQALLDSLNALYAGSGPSFPATSVNYAGSGTWVGAQAGLPASSVEVAIDSLVTILGSASAGASGAHKLGTDALVGASGTIVAGSIFAALTALKSATNHEYAGSGAWADASSLAASSTETAIDTIVSVLGNTGGAAKLGIAARTAWFGGRTNPATTIYLAVDKIITDLAATTAGDDGAERVGLQARSAWLGGRTNPAGDVFAGIDKIITDLAVTTAGDDGAERVGAQANGTLSAGSVRSQLDQLDTLKAALAGATFTGEVRQPRLNTSIQDIGVIASNTSVGAGVGLVRVQQPSTNTSYNIALQDPASGHPIIFVKFFGSIAASRLVYVVQPSDLNVSNPANYYGLWGPAALQGGYIFGWTGSRWEMLMAFGGVAGNGGGTLAS